MIDNSTFALAVTIAAGLIGALAMNSISMAYTEEDLREADSDGPGENAFCSLPPSSAKQRGFVEEIAELCTQGMYHANRVVLRPFCGGASAAVNIINSIGPDLQTAIDSLLDGRGDICTNSTCASAESFTFVMPPALTRTHSSRGHDRNEQKTTGGRSPVSPGLNCDEQFLADIAAIRFAFLQLSTILRADGLSRSAVEVIVSALEGASVGSRFLLLLDFPQLQYPALWFFADVVYFLGKDLTPGLLIAILDAVLYGNVDPENAQVQCYVISVIMGGLAQRPNHLGAALSLIEGGLKMENPNAVLALILLGLNLTARPPKMVHQKIVNLFTQRLEQEKNESHPDVLAVSLSFYRYSQLTAA